MSLKSNILANYAGQIYVTLIGILLVPVYIRYMGAEAYGLVGFFAMLQAWFQLLDMGLSPTMSREVARFKGGAGSARQLRKLLRALEAIFLALALVGSSIIIGLSDLLAAKWLKVEHLPLSEVETALKLMAAIAALRWISGLYRGAINGFERQVWLSGFNIAVATARFVLVIPLFLLVGTTPTIFFTYQLIVAVLELLALFLKTYRLLPQDRKNSDPGSASQVLSSLKFSLGIAFTGSIWVLVTQSDKLVLSKLLPLSDYAYFTLAVLLASGVTVVSTPISTALIPRLTRLSAANSEGEMVGLYRQATQLVTGIAIPAALVLGIFAEQVLLAWTGDAHIASKAAPVLTLYSLGNAVLVLAAFPYYLQFAKGNLRLHILGNAIFVVLLIPSLIWLTLRYGMLGAGYAWLGSNLLYFLIWVPVVHRRFVKGMHFKWLFQDIGVSAGVTAGFALLVQRAVLWPHERLHLVVMLAMLSIGLVFAGALSSRSLREMAMQRWRMRFAG